MVEISYLKPNCRSAGYQRADFLTEHDAAQIMRPEKVEHDDGHLVVHAE